MPPGGDGFYYFSTYLLGEGGKLGHFNIEINGELLCTVRTDQQDTSVDTLQSACSSVTYAVEGNRIVDLKPHSVRSANIRVFS